MKKHRVLLVVGYYLPGKKSGGVLRSVRNFIERYSYKYDFYIVTRDRDIGDDQGYDVPLEEWISKGDFYLYYIKGNHLLGKKVYTLLKETSCDLIYINSYFDPISFFSLVTCCLRSANDAPVLLAPRGEFSEGAIKLKQMKKRLYIKFLNFLGVNKRISFHASTQAEAADIIKAVDAKSSSIHVAMDLPTLRHGFNVVNKEEGSLKVIFLSRISPKKNLLYALSVMSQLDFEVVFDIYGPREDRDYWQKCQDLIKMLPDNIKCSYKGQADFESVSDTFAHYDVFLFPTLGENYGHVIVESLLAGTPVLISDNTPWKGLSEAGLGWDIPLSNKIGFINKLRFLSELDSDTKISLREKVLSSIYHELNLEKVELQNDFLLDKIISSRNN